MSRRKTVWCGYCMSKGHNRQTCKQLKHDIARTRETYGDEHFEVKEYDENQEAISASASARAQLPRKCTYCYVRGHNRRTCDVLNKHCKYAMAINKDYCKEIRDVMGKHGVGIGAILRIEDHKASSYLHRGTPTSFGQASSTSLWLIIEIRWDAINIIEPFNKTIVCRRMNDGRETILTAPSMPPTLAINSWDVASPSYALNFHSGWIEGDSVRGCFRSGDRDFMEDLLYEKLYHKKSE